MIESGDGIAVTRQVGAEKARGAAVATCQVRKQQEGMAAAGVRSYCGLRIPRMNWKSTTALMVNGVDRAGGYLKRPRLDRVVAAHLHLHSMNCRTEFRRIDAG
jgi:hypothetical protein